MATPPTRIQIRRGLSTTWPNYSLTPGELGFAYDTNELRIGNTGPYGLDHAKSLM